jgi:hypothetical protein
VDLIDLAQDRGHWWSLVDTVVNCGNILTNWDTEVLTAVTSFLYNAV